MNVYCIEIKVIVPVGKPEIKYADIKLDNM